MRDMCTTSTHIHCHCVYLPLMWWFSFECFYFYWITLSATVAVLPRGPVKATIYGSSVTTGGNWSTWRKPAILGKVKLDNTLLTCDQGNFNQITAQSQNRTLVTVMRETCTTTVPPAPPFSNIFVQTEIFPVDEVWKNCGCCRNALD